MLDPTENCPASQVGAEQIIADFKDEKSIQELAEKSDIITYEIESGNSGVLKSVEGKAEINPSPETLKTIQDKFLQKTFYSHKEMFFVGIYPVWFSKFLGMDLFQLYLLLILKHHCFLIQFHR